MAEFVQKTKPERPRSRDDLDAKMAEFVQKTKPERPRRDDLDAKINEHLNKSTPPSSSSKSGKKRRTFTDYPVTDEPIASKVSTSNSARGKNFVICSLLLHESSISSFFSLNKIASLVKEDFKSPILDAMSNS